MEGPDTKKTGRVRRALRRLLPWLGLYLDDLLIAAAGVCFTASATIAFGISAALAVAGACLLGYGILVGRARNRR
ncbi:MAG: hypothetical protein HFF19_01030 [Oscillospiraceae bacterium]|jgi:hypothetical protein|nr:hypothetical protein [Oscillospiraceae bacterium]